MCGGGGGGEGGRGVGGKEATYFRLESPVLPVELETELSWSANEEGAPVVSDFPSGLESTRRRRNIGLGRGGRKGGGGGGGGGRGRGGGGGGVGGGRAGRREVELVIRCLPQVSEKVQPV